MSDGFLRNGTTFYCHGQAGTPRLTNNVHDQPLFPNLTLFPESFILPALMPRRRNITIAAASLLLVPAPGPRHYLIKIIFLVCV
jgi:hypothetical protein